LRNKYKVRKEELGHYAAINAKEERGAACPASCAQSFKTEWGGRGAGKFAALLKERTKNQKMPGGGILQTKSILAQITR
jgi:hypothetical protein